MKRIHDKCVEYRPSGRRRVNYVQGANRAGFAKVADAMLANGVILGKPQSVETAMKEREGLDWRPCVERADVVSTS